MEDGSKLKGNCLLEPVSPARTQRDTGIWPICVNFWRYASQKTAENAEQSAESAEKTLSAYSAFCSAPLRFLWFLSPSSPFRALTPKLAPMAILPVDRLPSGILR